MNSTSLYRGRHPCICVPGVAEQLPANLERAAATAEKIVQESTRASVVVSRVRALFRKDAQVRELTDVNGVIQEMARLLRDEAIRRDVSIRLLLATQSSAIGDGPGADPTGAS